MEAWIAADRLEMTRVASALLDKDDDTDSFTTVGEDAEDAVADDRSLTPLHQTVATMEANLDQAVEAKTNKTGLTPEAAWNFPLRDPHGDSTGGNPWSNSKTKLSPD
jgi:hypothetical protein